MHQPFIHKTLRRACTLSIFAASLTHMVQAVAYPAGHCAISGPTSRQCDSLVTSDGTIVGNYCLMLSPTNLTITMEPSAGYALQQSYVQLGRDRAEVPTSGYATGTCSAKPKYQEFDYTRKTYYAAEQRLHTYHIEDVSSLMPEDSCCDNSIIMLGHVKVYAVANLPKGKKGYSYKHRRTLSAWTNGNDFCGSSCSPKKCDGAMYTNYKFSCKPKEQLFGDNIPKYAVFNTGSLDEDDDNSVKEFPFLQQLSTYFRNGTDGIYAGEIKNGSDTNEIVIPTDLPKKPVVSKRPLVKFDLVCGDDVDERPENMTATEFSDFLQSNFTISGLPSDTHDPNHPILVFNVHVFGRCRTEDYAFNPDLIALFQTLRQHTVWHFYGERIQSLDLRLTGKWFGTLFAMGDIDLYGCELEGQVIGSQVKVNTESTLKYSTLVDL